MELNSFDNRALRHGVLPLLVLMLSGCQRANEVPAASEGDAPLTVSAFVDQPVLSYAEYLALSPWADADVSAGERIAMQCKACHTLHRDGVNMVGPNLFGVFGRPAASTARFDYSAALRDAGISWSPAALDAWLANPARFLPGNRMPFAGIRNKADRDDLIAYLLSVTNDTGGNDVDGGS